MKPIELRGHWNLGRYAIQFCVSEELGCDLVIAQTSPITLRPRECTREQGSDYEVECMVRARGICQNRQFKAECFLVKEGGIWSIQFVLVTYDTDDVAPNYQYGVHLGDPELKSHPLGSLRA